MLHLAREGDKSASGAPLIFLLPKHHRNKVAGSLVGIVDRLRNAVAVGKCGELSMQHNIHKKVILILYT